MYDRGASHGGHLFVCSAYFLCLFTDPFILLLILMQNTQTLDEFLKDRGGQQTFRPGFGETVDEVDEITIPKG